MNEKGFLEEWGTLGYDSQKNTINLNSIYFSKLRDHQENTDSYIFMEGCVLMMML
jgi:hypothetical protein